MAKAAKQAAADLAERLVGELPPVHLRRLRAV